jgi:hypothetical protein
MMGSFGALVLICEHMIFSNRDRGVKLTGIDKLRLGRRICRDVGREGIKAS